MAAELVLAPVAEKVIEKIIDACYEYLEGQVRWQRGLKKELQKLRNILPQIQAVVSTYSQVEIKDEALNKWYWLLRDAVDEADDVLDEIEYRKLQKQASKNKKIEKVRSLMKSIKKRVVEITKRAVKIDSYLKRLEVAVQKLNEISAEVSNFKSLVERTEQNQQKQQLKLLETRETGAMLGNDFVGRSNEITRVKDWLRNSYETQSTNTTDLYRNISLFSVVGHGGMGKTTLLQRIYEDVTLNKDGATEGFDVKMWACVSQNFNAQTVIKNILKSLNENVSVGEPLHSLQSSLQSKVTSKRFLLVLDDIWDEGEAKWENVLAPLQYGSSGSKILITTRMHSGASMFAPMIKKCNEKLPLESMEEKELLELFNRHAFAGVENPEDEFKNIAEKIVEKLLGCPLAAKLIGNILNSCRDKSFWRTILTTNISNIKPLKSGQNDLLAILKLSYTYLPECLQNCFSFCCIFPQNYKFDKDDLVRMWIAVGFIHSSDIPGDTLENTGRRYFNILVQKSFFDEFHTGNYRPYYKMHDLLHDLAQSVSKQECLRVVGDKKLSIPETIRHLSIVTPSLEVSKEMNKFKHLRSLLLSSKVAKFENVISQILKASKSLRLLVIDAPNNNYSVPEKIDGLIHLRYLKINCWVLKLSRSISHLYHLQFVISKRPQNLVMDNISWEELRPNKNCHLIMDELVIEDLNSAVLMEPLRSISYLRFLTIENNDNLVSFPSEAELWFLQRSSTLLQLIFKNLQSLQSLPPLSSFSSLTYLILKNIPLLKSLPDLPSSLKKLELWLFKSLESLPSSLSAIPSLKTLELHNIPLLKSLPDLPSSLKMLELYDTKSLESLPSSLSAISSLETLQLRDVPLLKSLPDLPSSLKNLELYHVESLESLPSSLSAIPSLETLELVDIPLLKSLPDLPSSLKKLELYQIESLESLPSSLSSIPSLETIELDDIPLLKSLPDLPSSLEALYLEKLENLDCLPSCLPTRLRELEVFKVRRLLELPDLPASLEVLYIQECDPQLMERYPKFGFGRWRFR